MLHLSDYLGMKLTDIINDDGHIILEFNSGPSLVFNNVRDNNITFSKKYDLSDKEKEKIKKDIEKNKKQQKKRTKKA